MEDKCGFGGMSVYGKTFKDEIAGYILLLFAVVLLFAK